MSSNLLSGVVSALVPTRLSDVLLDVALPGARQVMGIAKAVGAEKAKKAAPAAPAAPAQAAGASAAAKVSKARAARPAARPRVSSSTKARKPATTSSRATGYAKTSAKDDFSFLRDPAISVEQKLMRFMALMAKRLDADIVDKMDELRPGGATRKAGGSGASSGTKSGGASGTGGSAKGGAVGGFLGTLSGLLNDKTLKPILRQVSGPVLSAAASAMGFPAAAPFLMKAGPQIFDFAANASKSLGGGGATGSASSSSGGASTTRSGTSSGAGGLDSTDEKLKYMELQSLVDKQKEMMTLVSNMLRSMHDMHMASINNLR